MIIDAHHHFWKYDAVQYPWIAPDSALARDYLPADLQKLIDAAGVEGVVSVQARQMVEETRWLLSLARDNAWIKGVVGWVPLIDKSLETQLAPLAEDKKLKSVRHVLQDESHEYMLQDAFHRGIDVLARFDLRYDLLITEQQLPSAIKLVDRHPKQIFVLDHIAKPRIKDKVLSPWKENLRELARREHVYCKLSGMVTEDDRAHWSLETLRPYMDAALEAFGAERLMFGSDWPVCLLASDYGRWKRTVDQFAATLTRAQANHLMGQTAIEAYRL